MFLAKEIKYNDAVLAFKNSTHISLFSCPQFLKALGYKARFFGGYKNNELLVVWPLIEKNKSLNKPPEFSYYFGPYWLDNSITKSPSKKYRNNLEVINCLIAIIEKKAPMIEFSLTPEFTDLRPFLWWNYHESEKEKFKINLKYSAKIDFKTKKSNEEIITSFRADDKRKKLRKILKENKLKISFGITQNINFYINLYKQTLLRSGGRINKIALDEFKKLIELENKNFSNLVSIKVIELFKYNLYEPIGFQLMLSGKGKVYALAQCTTDQAKKLHGNIMLTYSALCYANRMNFTFDFNGANSPLRADDKHAFGAESIQYFDLSLKGKK